MRVIALVAVVAVACADDASSASGLCSAAETTYFSCQASKSRWISLCGKPDVSLQYRFGTLAKRELTFPHDASTGKTSFLFAHYFRAETDYTEVTFTNNDVSYAVFDYSENGKNRAGVRVTKNDGKDVEVVCSGKVTSRLPELERMLKCDTDNALTGGSCR